MILENMRAFSTQLWNGGSRRKKASTEQDLI